MEKAIIFQGGQNYGRKYWSTLLDLIKRGKQHACFVVPTSCLLIAEGSGKPFDISAVFQVKLIPPS